MDVIVLSFVEIIEFDEIVGPGIFHVLPPVMTTLPPILQFPATLPPPLTIKDPVPTELESVTLSNDIIPLTFKLLETSILVGVKFIGEKLIVVKLSMFAVITDRLLKVVFPATVIFPSKYVFFLIYIPPLTHKAALGEGVIDTSL